MSDLYPQELVTAMNFAMCAHFGQKRKYIGDPYWNHCRNVAEQVQKWGGTLNMQCASYLHDTLEDTNTTVGQLNVTFGPEVTKLVVELTDVYTHKAYPGLNRAIRKQLEANRIASTSLEARVIKLADIEDNTKSIEAYDKGFALVYTNEKAYLLSLIGNSLHEYQRSLLP